jgi:hypothetical protein
MERPGALPGRSRSSALRQRPVTTRNPVTAAGRRRIRARKSRRSSHRRSR